jgi:hypothetical protein
MNVTPMKVIDERVRTKRTRESSFRGHKTTKYFARVRPEGGIVSNVYPLNPHPLVSPPLK